MSDRKVQDFSVIFLSAFLRGLCEAAGSGKVRPCEDGRSGVSPSMAGRAKRRSGVAGMRGLSEQDIDAERL